MFQVNSTAKKKPTGNPNLYLWALTENVKKAEEIAKKYHKGQTDKAGNPYYLHPLRVTDMLCETEISDAISFRKCQITALLHDILEDTEYTLEQLSQDFGEEIADAVLSVTRRDGESYMDFIKRSAEHPIGRHVKLCDITDNLDIRRLADCPDYKLTEDDFARIRKYVKAYRYLKNKI